MGAAGPPPGAHVTMGWAMASIITPFSIAPGPVTGCYPAWFRFLSRAGIRDRRFALPLAGIWA